MANDQLYDAAFRYKKAGVWKKLWDSEIFAISLSSGETGYVSIMGKDGTYCALGLYIGEAGFQGWRAIANAGGHTGSPFRDREMLLQQNCLQMVLENKEFLMPEEVDEVRAYARANGIRLSGKNAFPQFIKFEPNCHPWKVKTQEDQQALYEALQAAILMADLLHMESPEDIGITPIQPYTREVPLFEIKGDRLVHCGSAPLPGDREESYEYVSATNEIALASVKKLKQTGIWESELIRLTEPVQDHPEETPYYPLLLLAVESQSYYMLPIPVVRDSEQNPDAMLAAFAESWKKQKVYPKEIRCRDERTYALLKDFCEKTNVKISIYEGEMDALDDVEYQLYDHMTGQDEAEKMDEIASTIEMLLQMSPAELQMMPQPLMEELRMMLDEGVLPADLTAELKRKLNLR